MPDHKQADPVPLVGRADGLFPGSDAPARIDQAGVGAAEGLIYVVIATLLFTAAVFTIVGTMVQIGALAGLALVLVVAIHLLGGSAAEAP